MYKIPTASYATFFNSRVEHISELKIPTYNSQSHGGLKRAKEIGNNFESPTIE